MFDVNDNPNNNNNNNNNNNINNNNNNNNYNIIIINKINKYYGNTSKSVFDIKDFEMSKENFLE